MLFPKPLFMPEAEQRQPVWDWPQMPAPMWRENSGRVTLISAARLNQNGAELARDARSHSDNAPLISRSGPVIAVEAAVLNRFGQMLGQNRFGPVQIRDGSRDFQDAVMRPGAEPMRRTAISSVRSPASSRA